MHIFTSPTLIANIGALTTYVDQIADSVAQLILMIESGKQLFIDGRPVPAPHAPFMIKDMGYCTIGFQPKSAQITILTPAELGHYQWVFQRIVSALNSSILRFSPESHTRHQFGLSFGMRQLAYIPSPDNYVTSIEQSIMTERRFVDGRAPLLNMGNNAAFIWTLSESMPMGETRGLIDQWVVDASQICINLYGPPGPARAEIPMPTKLDELIPIIVNRPIQFIRAIAQSISCSTSSGWHHRTTVWAESSAPKIDLNPMGATITATSWHEPTAFISLAPTGADLVARVLESTKFADASICQICMRPLWSACLGFPLANGVVPVCLICAAIDGRIATASSLLPMIRFRQNATLADVFSAATDLPAGLSSEVIAQLCSAPSDARVLDGTLVGFASDESLVKTAIEYARDRSNAGMIIIVTPTRDLRICIQPP